MAVEKLIAAVMAELKQIVKTETVVGDPVCIEGTVILPVSKVSFGFGAGGGGGEAGGGGTGGGVSIEPVAFVVLTEGKAHLLSIKGKEVSLGKVFELVPDLIGKFMGGKDKSKPEKEEKEEKAKEEKKRGG